MDFAWISTAAAFLDDLSTVPDIALAEPRSEAAGIRPPLRLSMAALIALRLAPRQTGDVVKSITQCRALPPKERPRRRMAGLSGFRHGGEKIGAVMIVRQIEQR